MFLPQNEKNNPGIFGGDGCVYYLESDASNLSVYICPNSLDCFHYMSFFVHQLYLSKAGAGGGRRRERRAKELHSLCGGSRWCKGPEAAQV